MHGDRLQESMRHVDKSSDASHVLNTVSFTAICCHCHSHSPSFIQSEIQYVAETDATRKLRYLRLEVAGHALSSRYVTLSLVIHGHDTLQVY